VIGGVLYACTGEDLLTVDPVTGQVTNIGPIFPGATCNDLGATWLSVPCL
jgi:hypothetical protein